MAATEYLRVTDLHAFYGESHVLHGVDFTVNRGEVVTLLGRNGAGRTTTLRAILGLTEAELGAARDHIAAVLDVALDQLLDVHLLRPLLVEGQQRDAEGREQQADHGRRRAEPPAQVRQHRNGDRVGDDVGEGRERDERRHGRARAAEGHVSAIICA